MGMGISFDGKPNGLSLEFEDAVSLCQILIGTVIIACDRYDVRL